ncbi:hypothetical protein [Geotalea toluenoxydans]|uniref:hypothetical protein n=1 Tax=Geotalea toluenoxydans TaxID=421624 RepID=UPI0006CF6158|nr:hypothetical protein [Geotalea toluenoxydans]
MDCTLSQQWRNISLKEKIELFLIVSGLFLTLVGVFIAGIALKEYKMTNKVARLAQLQSIDRDLIIMNMDKPFLDSIWAIIPDTISGKKRADMQLSALWTAGKDKTSLSVPHWSTVEDLEKELYRAGTFTNANMERLRQAYLYLESVLYLVADTYDAQKQNLISEDEAKINYAYLTDLGDHPLFLHAIWFGHKGGYIRAEFADMLKANLISDPDKKATISEIYPDLLKDEWVATIGKKKEGPTRTVER